tara:strand:- start:1523 stop:1687 length:165 start_codon:yes stop_codon:yes gene_type:complete
MPPPPPPRYFLGGRATAKNPSPNEGISRSCKGTPQGPLSRPPSMVKDKEGPLEN